MSGDIKTVMDAHVNELMAISGVVGVAIGVTEGGVPCIQVLIAEATDELMKQIPELLEGHPVVTVVTGIIRGVPDGQDGV